MNERYDCIHEIEKKLTDVNEYLDKCHPSLHPGGREEEGSNHSLLDLFFGIFRQEAAHDGLGLRIATRATHTHNPHAARLTLGLLPLEEENKNIIVEGHEI